jgi:hypothetical protein
MRTDEGTTDCGCPSCELGDVEGLACRAAKYQKQAEIMTAIATELATDQTQYADARKAYSEAWSDTQAEIAAVRAQLDELLELLVCRLDDDQKECLDRVAGEVFDATEECSPDPGCCVDDCEFDDQVPQDATLAWLTTRIDDYRRQTVANTACFTSLVGEAQTVTAQVAAIKAEVTNLATAVTSGGDATKLIRWYARWLIASYRLDLTRLGHGFTSVSAYGDCLCKALQCIASGWAAIAVLEGARAELACLEKAREDSCKQKKEQTLEAILEAYDRCCQPEEDDNDKEHGGSYGGHADPKRRQGTASMSGG